MSGQEGFSFDNVARNKELSENGIKEPAATKTGTTIAGLVFNEGIVLGADTRATEGMIVADKNCEKIHYISPRIYCCGAGTAADTEFTTALISSNLEMHQLVTGRQVRVVTAVTMLKQHLYKHQGYIGAALVLGGVDFTGSHLYSVHPHGSVDKLPFVTMGSGSLAAMAVFESQWEKNIDREKAIKLVTEAIEAGILNDLGSGSNVDITVITEKGVDVLREYKAPTRKQKKEAEYIYPPGSTVVLEEHVYSRTGNTMEICH